MTMTNAKNADEVYLAILRRKTGEERLRLGMELYEMAFKVAQDGIRHQYPDWNYKQVHDEAVRRFVQASGRKC